MGRRGAVDQGAGRTGEPPVRPDLRRDTAPRPSTSGSSGSVPTTSRARRAHDGRRARRRAGRLQRPVPRRGVGGRRAHCATCAIPRCSRAGATSSPTTLPRASAPTTTSSSAPTDSENPTRSRRGVHWSVAARTCLVIGERMNQRVGRSTTIGMSRPAVFWYSPKIGRAGDGLRPERLLGVALEDVGAHGVLRALHPDARGGVGAQVLEPVGLLRRATGGADDRVGAVGQPPRGDRDHAPLAAPATDGLDGDRARRRGARGRASAGPCSSPSATRRTTSP